MSLLICSKTAVLYFFCMIHCVTAPHLWFDVFAKCDSKLRPKGCFNRFRKNWTSCDILTCDCLKSGFNLDFPLAVWTWLKRTYLAVKSQQQQHDKEQDGPECWHWHHGHSFGVRNEGQAGTWWEIEGGRGGEKGGEVGINIFVKRWLGRYKR